MNNLHNHRRNYTKFQLDKSTILKDPFLQFNLWLNEAIEDGTFEANAMILSTVNGENKPSSRVVLLKQVVEEGLIFFTNYTSRKGEDIENNKNASILFFWEKFERQVRIEGQIEKISKDLSEDYFRSRPLESQIGSAISNQSKVIENRLVLEKKYDKFKSKNSIKMPENWGGYILEPNYFEFWQGRAKRLHDRIEFNKKDENWIISRLSP